MFYKSFWFWLGLGVLGFIFLPASWAAVGGALIAVGYFVFSNVSLED